MSLPSTPLRIPVAGSSIARNVSLGIAFTALSNLFLFGGHLTLLRLLSRSDYAHFSVAVSFVSLLAMVADFGMTPLITRLFVTRGNELFNEDHDDGDLFGSILFVRLSLSTLAAVLTIAVGSLLYSWTIVGNFAILLPTLLVSSRLLAIRSVGESLLRAQSKYSIVAALAFLDSLSFFVLLSSSRVTTLHSALWIYSACNLPGFFFLVCIIGLKFYKSGLLLRVKWSVVRGIFRRSLPLTLGTIFVTIHLQIDTILLDRLSTSDEVSLYAATIRIISAAIPIAMVLSFVIAPELTKLLHAKDFSRARRLTSMSARLMIVGSSITAICVTLTASELAPIILGHNYQSAGGILSLTIWMLLPAFLAQFFIETSVAANKLWLPTIYTGVIMVVVIIGDVLLIPTFGAQGAVIAKVTSLSVGIAVMVWLTKGTEYIQFSDLFSTITKTFLCILISLVTAILFSRAELTSDIVSAIIAVIIFSLLCNLFKIVTSTDVRFLFRTLIPSKHKIQ